MHGGLNKFHTVEYYANTEHYLFSKFPLEFLYELENE
jgi:hypothetical protein